jgi:hypothetical protein
MANEDLRLTLIGGPALLIEWSGLRLLTDRSYASAAQMSSA